jgi:AraC-like DNA-binding protein
MGHDVGVTSPSTQLLLDLFEATPHVMICVKGVDGRYIAVNRAFVRRTTCRHPRDIVGKTAAECYPESLALAYEAQDRSLFRTGIAIRNQLEIIPDSAGRPEWFLTTKLLHHDPGNAPEIVAVSTQAQLGPRRQSSAPGLRAALELTTGDDLGALSVDDLAEAAGMSIDQLERSMALVLGVSPKQYLMRARIDRASTLIATTHEPISTIAARCGYYDQSQLTRYFKAAVGLTPAEYRRNATAQAAFSS